MHIEERLNERPRLQWRKQKDGNEIKQKLEDATKLLGKSDISKETKTKDDKDADDSC